MSYRMYYGGAKKTGERLSTADDMRAKTREQGRHPAFREKTRRKPKPAAAAAAAQLEVEGAVLVPESGERWRPTPGQFYIQWINRSVRMIGLHENIAEGEASLSVPASKLSEWAWCWEWPGRWRAGETVTWETVNMWQPGDMVPMRRAT